MQHKQTRLSLQQTLVPWIFPGG